MAKNTAERVRELLTGEITALGYRIWDLEYVREGSEWYLRITIDSDDGITINDCEKVHRAIDPILDEADPIEDSYHLEVSSPGIERDLKTDAHLEACIGDNVEIRLFTALDGQKVYSGKLAGYTPDMITVNCGGTEKAIQRSLISKIKTTFEF